MEPPSTPLVSFRLRPPPPHFDRSLFVQETVEKHGKIVLEKIKAQALQVQETAATLALAVANKKQKKAKAKKKWGTTRGEAKRIIDKMLFNYRR